MEISGNITIPAPTGTGYTSTILDFSSRVPTNIDIHYHIISLGRHMLPYREPISNTITYSYDPDYINHNLTIKSNTKAWNNYTYFILLIYKR